MRRLPNGLHKVKRVNYIHEVFDQRFVLTTHMYIKIANNQKVIIFKSDTRYKVCKVPNKIFIEFWWSIDHRTEKSSRKLYLKELQLKAGVACS